MTDLLEKMKSVGIYHFSPSQLNRPLANWMFEYVYLSKEKRREIVGDGSRIRRFDAILCEPAHHDTSIWTGVLGGQIP